MPIESTVKLTSNGNSVTTSLKSFNLYDTNTFTTFFYSSIEKIWFITVKTGKVKINGEEFTGSRILYNKSQIQYDSINITFHNLKDEVGLSQILVEKFLRSKNSKILQDHIFEIMKDRKDQQLVMECLKRNALFSHNNGEWSLNYSTYIEFLELKSDPLISSIFYELEHGYESYGLTKTFNVCNLWSSPGFSDEQISIETESHMSDINYYNRIPNWPHSSRSPSNQIETDVEPRIEEENKIETSLAVNIGPLLNKSINQKIQNIETSRADDNSELNFNSIDNNDYELSRNTSNFRGEEQPFPTAVCCSNDENKIINPKLYVQQSKACSNDIDKVINHKLESQQSYSIFDLENKVNNNKLEILQSISCSNDESKTTNNKFEILQNICSSNDEYKINNKLEIQQGNCDLTPEIDSFQFLYCEFPSTLFKKRKTEYLYTPKRFKLQQNIEFSTVVVDLTDSEMSEARMQGRYFSECEYSMIPVNKPGRPRSYSTFDGRDYKPKMVINPNSFEQRRRDKRTKSVSDINGPSF